MLGEYIYNGKGQRSEKWIETDGKCTVFHYDQNGLLIAESQPLGEEHSVTGSITNNLRFPGQYYDDETGLHYNYFRDYKLEIGRYLEGDPIGIKQGMNHLYGYVGNNSMNRTDEYGLWAYKGYCRYISGGDGERRGYSSYQTLNDLSGFSKISSMSDAVVLGYSKSWL